MEDEIERRVKHLAKEIRRETIESSGVDTEVSEKEMIQYAHEVVQEVREELRKENNKKYVNLIKDVRFMTDFNCLASEHLSLSWRWIPSYA